jgi:predicted DNA-binding transcriptional regulator AlpA
MRLLTAKEVADMISVKPKTLYQWAELRQMPHIKLNGCLRFDPDAIFAWIKSCSKEPSSSYNPLIQTRGPKKGGD